MGLAQAHSTVDKERVVDETRGLGHGERRRVGEPVAGPDHEGVERVLGPEGPRRPRVQDGLRALRARAVTGMVAGACDADHQGGLVADHVVEHLLQERPESALDVLLGERVGYRDLQLILIEVHGTYALEPDPERRDVYVFGRPVQHLIPHLLRLAGHDYLTQALTMASTRSLPSGEMRRLPDSSAMTRPCSSRTERSL